MVLEGNTRRLHISVKNNGAAPSFRVRAECQPYLRYFDEFELFVSPEVTAVQEITIDGTDFDKDIYRCEIIAESDDQSYRETTIVEVN